MASPYLQGCIMHGSTLIFHSDPLRSYPITQGRAAAPTGQKPLSTAAPEGSSPRFCAKGFHQMPLSLSASPRLLFPSSPLFTECIITCFIAFVNEFFCSLNRFVPGSCFFALGDGYFECGFLFFFEKKNQKTFRKILVHSRPRYRKKAFLML